jgi:hypothetical protein
MKDRTETYQNNTSLVEYLRKFEMRWQNKGQMLKIRHLGPETFYIVIQYRTTVS